MLLRRAGDIQCRHREDRLCVFRADRIAQADRIGRQLAMVRIEQHDIRAVIKLAIGHELIDISLADALFRIVDLRRHPLPFRVDDQPSQPAHPAG